MDVVSALEDAYEYVDVAERNLRKALSLLADVGCDDICDEVYLDLRRLVDGIRRLKIGLSDEIEDMGGV